MPEQTAEPKRVWSWLLVVMATGMVLRTLMLSHEALWGDEALSLVIATFPVGELFLKPVDPTPGLYYLIQKWWLAVGDAAWIVRLPSWLFGILTIPASFWLARTCAGPRAGLITALMVALLPPLVDHSQEARAYALLILLETLALAAFCAGAQAHGLRRTGFLILSAIASLLAIYTHVTAWVLVAPLALHAVMRASREGWYRPIVIVSVVGAGVLSVIPEFFRMLAYTKVNQFNWLSQFTPLEVASLYARLIVPVPVTTLSSANGIVDLSLSGMIAVGIVAGLLVAALLWIVGPRVIGSIRRHPLSHEASFALVLLLIVHPFLLYTAGILTPMMLPRTALPFCIGVALAAGVCFARLPSNGGWIAFALIVASEHLLFGTVRPKPAYDQIARALAERPDVPVLVCDDWNGSTIAHSYALTDGPPRRFIVLAASTFVEVADEGDRPSAWLGQFGTRLWRPRIGIDRGAARPFIREPSSIRNAYLVDAGCSSSQRETIDHHFAIDRDRPILSVFPLKPVHIYRIQAAAASDTP